MYRPVHFHYYTHWEISEISCIVNLQYRAVPLTSGNSTLYSTILEQSLNIIPTIVTCSVHTKNKAHQFGAWVIFASSEKDLCPPFPFLFWVAFILAFGSVTSFFPCTNSISVVCTELV